MVPVCLEDIQKTFSGNKVSLNSNDYTTKTKTMIRYTKVKYICYKEEAYTWEKRIFQKLQRKRKVGENEDQLPKEDLKESIPCV